jgi:SHS2 domain-containing protein
MGSFEILPHTADVGFRAHGTSLADLFETAARAMFSIEYDLPSVALEEKRAVEAQADDIEGLLEGWLSELLWLHDATGFVPTTFSVREIGPVGGGGPEVRVAGTAEGRLIGDWFEQTGPQIKAVTLHGLEVRRVDGHWEATVYLDV